MKKDKTNASTNDINVSTTNDSKQNKQKDCKCEMKYLSLNSHNPKLIKTSEWLGGALLIVAVIIYVTLGCLMHNWSKTWMIFIFVPVIPSILVCIAKRGFNFFGIAFLITGIYCAIGMNVGMWHPTWIMFFGILLYHAIATWIDKEAIKKSKTDDKLVQEDNK